MKKTSIKILLLLGSMQSMCGMEHALKPDNADAEPQVALTLGAYPITTHHSAGKHNRHHWTTQHGKETDPYNAVAWSPCGEKLAGAWNGPQGLLLFKAFHKWAGSIQKRFDAWHANTNQVNGVAWKPDGRQLAIASNATLILLDPNNLKLLHKINHWIPWLSDYSGSHIKALAWSTDGKTLAFAEDHNVRMLNTDDGANEPGSTSAFFRSLFSVEPNYRDVVSLHHLGEPRSLSWSPDAMKLAVGLNNGIAIWNRANNGIQTLESTDQLDDNVVNWSPNGERLASGSSDGRVRIWSTKSWQLLSTLLGAQAVRALKWCPRSERLAVNAGSELTLWNVSNSQQTHSLGIPKDEVQAKNPGKELEVPADGDQMLGLDWHPGGDHIAASNNSGLLRVWNLNPTKETK